MNKLGFTLVELIVAISILGVVTAIGLSRYIGAGQSAGDAKKRADIDSIANAYEVNFDFSNKVYSPLTKDDFSGSFPKVPDGTDYLFIEGPGSRNPDINAVKNSKDSFLICAKVKEGCYCRKSANESPLSLPSCP